MSQKKVKYPDIEEKLLKWLKERREKGGTGKALKLECLRLHRLYGNQSFKAFKKRNRIVMRKTTHIS